MVFSFYYLCGTEWNRKTKFFLKFIVVRTLFKALLVRSMRQQVLFLCFFFLNLVGQLVEKFTKIWMGDRLGLLLLSILNIFENSYNKKNTFGYKLKS